MSIPRPKGRARRLVENPGTYESSAFIAPLLSLFPAAYRFYRENDTAWMYFTGGGAILQCLLGAGKALATLRKTAQDVELHDLAGCLHTMHAVLVADWKRAEDPGLRLTIHVPIGGDKLQQAVDYIGSERVKNTAGRVFPSQSGITGRALREKETFVASRKNTKYEAYVQELVSEWNYTEADARGRSPATMSWLAIPLTNERTETVEGIVYADSTERAFFTKRRIAVAHFASIGIGVFVSKRYGKSG